MKPNETAQSSHNLLTKAGLKVTAPRVAILNTLINAAAPLTAQEIHQKLVSAKIDQATVYRNLETLTSLKILRPVNFRHDHNHYELASHHHHHAICEGCGKVSDISSCDLTGWDKQVKKISGFAEINQHALEFFGLCKTCAKQ